MILAGGVSEVFVAGLLRTVEVTVPRRLRGFFES